MSIKSTRAAMAVIEEKEIAQFDWALLKRLLAYLKPYKLRLLVMYSFATINVLCGLMIPILVKIGIDEHIATGDWSGLLTTSTILGVMVVLLFIAARVQGRMMMKVGYRVLYDLRADLFRHLQNMSFKYFDSNKTGQIMSRLTNDVQVLEELLQGGLDTVLVDVLIILGITIAMFSLDPRLSLILLITVPTLVFVVFILRSRIIDAGRGIQRTLSLVNAFLNESISGIKVIRSFAREDENIQAFAAVNEDYFAETKKFYPLLAYFWQSVAALNVIGKAMVLGGGGLLLYYDAITIGVIAAFLAYINRFFQPMQKISNMLNQMSRAMASAERVFELMDIEPEVEDSIESLSADSLIGDIVFRKVWFSYNREETVLRDISFCVTPGQTLAIVGETGSGKTTIISLLSRFYDPAFGAILVDGHDIREYSQESYRSRIALVMQDAGMFSGSVSDAVRYGKPDASQAEIEQVVRDIGFHESVMSMPHGYDTNIGERGSLLSLGQRQLLAFARALIRDPSILILDEASAYLDSQSELLVQNAMKRLCRGRTSFVIAHRLSTIRDADRILVIDKGVIQESGSHDELMATGGHYCQLIRTQYGLR